MGVWGAVCVTHKKKNLKKISGRDDLSADRRASCVRYLIMPRLSAALRSSCCATFRLMGLSKRGTGAGAAVVQKHWRGNKQGQTCLILPSSVPRSLRTSAVPSLSVLTAQRSQSQSLKRCRLAAAAASVQRRTVNLAHYVCAQDHAVINGPSSRGGGWKEGRASTPGLFCLIAGLLTSAGVWLSAAGREAIVSHRGWLEGSRSTPRIRKVRWYCQETSGKSNLRNMGPLISVGSPLILILPDLTVLMINAASINSEMKENQTSVAYRRLYLKYVQSCSLLLESSQSKQVVLCNIDLSHCSPLS